MRECAKLGCREPAAATVGLRYAERVLWVGDLLDQRDPNLIDLCRGHADGLVQPYGWARLDERTPAAAQPARLSPVVDDPVEVPQVADVPDTPAAASV